VNQFLWGALAALSAVAGIFFWKFWQRTRDGLFVAFAAGFSLLAFHWAGLGVLNPSSDTRHYLYFVRLAAFALIIGGVVQKNRTASS
jgi:Family of unknown function (DUF5985)